MAIKPIRSVRLSGEQLRALIDAVSFSRAYNNNLSEDQCSLLDLAREPLSKALGAINFERSRNGLRGL